MFNLLTRDLIVIIFGYLDNCCLNNNQLMLLNQFYYQNFSNNYIFNLNCIIDNRLSYKYCKKIKASFLKI